MHVGRIAALATLPIACARPPRSHVVDLRNFGYSPRTVIAQPGDTLVFTNYDIVSHTATARDGAWDTGEIAPAQSARIVVRKGGEYFCTLHPNMTASVEVK
jgi:plastocyanin